MKAKLVAIGNSRGIRIPKALLVQGGFEGDVDLSLRDGELVVRPLHRPREGWERAFAEMARQGDDCPVFDDPALPLDVDTSEWTW